MKSRKILQAILPLTALSLLLGTQGTAKESSKGNDWTRYQDFKVHLHIPEGWQIQRDLFGMPIMVLGPERNGERAVMSVQHTAIRNLKFDHPALSRTQGQYYEGRKRWIEELGDSNSRYLGGLPLERLSWSNGNDGFKIGYRYQMRGLEFQENSIQVNCGNRLFLFKTLTSTKSPAEDRQALAGLIRELDCQATNEQDGPYRPSVLQDLKQRISARVNGETPWPTREQIQKASPESRAVVREALIEFQKSFEEAGGNDFYAYHSAPKDGAFAAIRERATRFAGLFMESATAKEGYDCFFGGWPSKFVKVGGRLTCGYPWNENESYKKSGNSCDSGELACNPSLFGKDVCVSVATSYERNRATVRCEEEFVKKGGDFEKIENTNGFNKELLDETYSSTEAVCKSEPYVSANYGLCSTLAGKLKIAIDPPAHPEQVVQNSGETYLNGTSNSRPDEIASQSVAALAGFSDFENRCLNDQGELNLEDESCLSDTAAITEDLESLDRNTRLLEDELAAQYATEADSVINNENCADCGSKGSPDVALKPVGCSASEKKAMEAGKCQWTNVAWYAKQGASCNMNLLSSVVESLWDTVKAIGGLAWDGVKWVGNKVRDGVVSTGKWFASLFGYEDQSSKKVNVASQVSNSFLKELLAHPIDTVMKMFSAIWDGIQHYLDYDAYCQKWSGVPHFSTCLIPGTDGCVSCSAQFTGACSVIGYVIGEVLPAVFTGGGSAAASGAGLSAQIAGALGKAGKAGKMGRVLNRVNKVAKVVKDSKIVAKAVSVGEGAAKVARWPAQKIRRVKKSLEGAKKKLSAFKSPRFGNYRKVLVRLRGLRKKYFLLKVGVWTVNWAVVKPAKAAVKVTKAVVKASVTVPKKVIQPTLKVQEKAFELGARYGEKYGNRLLRKTVDQALSNPVNWGRASPQLDKALASSAAQLSGMASTQVSSAVRWFGTRANLIGNLYQGKNVLDQAVQIDWTNPETIRTIARTEGKSEDEVRRSLKAERLNRLTVDGVRQALKTGGEPTDADFKRVEAFTGHSRDELRMESIEERVNGATLSHPPKFQKADYSLFAEKNSLTLPEGRKKLDQLVEGKVLEESVMGALNSGREPDPAQMKRLVSLMNGTGLAGDAEVSADGLRVNSIYARAMGVNGLRPVFNQGDYEAWARLNGITVEEAKVQIQQSVETMTSEGSSPR